MRFIFSTMFCLNFMRHPVKRLYPDQLNKCNVFFLLLNIFIYGIMRGGGIFDIVSAFSITPNFAADMYTHKSNYGVKYKIIVLP